MMGSGGQELLLPWLREHLGEVTWLLVNPPKKVADSTVRIKVADRCWMLPRTYKGSGWSSDQAFSESKREGDVLDGITTWVQEVIYGPHIVLPFHCPLVKCPQWLLCSLTPVISCCFSFQGREVLWTEGGKGGRQRVETGEGGWKCPFSNSHFYLSERVVVRTKKKSWM